MNYIFLVIQLFLLSYSKIELSLYKPSNFYSEIFSINSTIEDIEYSRFLTDLKLGSPIQSYPLEIKMSSDEILILNDNYNNDNIKSKKIPLLSDKTSKTFQIVKDINNNKKPSIDKFIIDKSSFDLKFESIDKISYDFNIFTASGIIGFSLGDIESNNYNNIFIDQLYNNKLISNSIFYFHFNEPKLSKNKVITLEDYLNLNGKVIIGEYPNNILKKDKKNNNEYILKTSPVLERLKIQPNVDPILYDDSSYSILLNFNKCVGCTLCAKSCSTISGQNILECEKGKKSHTKSGKLLADTPCISCGQCSLACSLSAITEHYNKDEVSNILKNKQGKIVVCQIAPAVRINMAEALGVEVGTISTGKIVTALKMLGFDYIFDTTFSADMTIVEEATEFIKRFYDPKSVLPMFTS